MKNLKKVIAVVTLFFALQTTMVSCTNDNGIIKDKQNVTQLENDVKVMVDPAHGGGGDDDDEETGSNN